MHLLKVYRSSQQLSRLSMQLTRAKDFRGKRLKGSILSQLVSKFRLGSRIFIKLPIGRQGVFIPAAGCCSLPARFISGSTESASVISTSATDARSTDSKPAVTKPASTVPATRLFSGATECFFISVFAATSCATSLRPPVASRDHVAAGLLAIFLGFLGIHKFYLGYNTQGFIMLSIALIGGLLSFGLVMELFGLSVLWKV